MTAPSSAVPGAASTLLAGLLGCVPTALREVVRTPVSRHYETGDADVPVLCLATPHAVRLPNTVVVVRLPDALTGTSAVTVTRWWQPPRPRGLVAPRLLPDLPAATVVVPSELVGRGSGLTPEGDDVLAGVLVAAHAVGDERLPRWQHETRVALATRRTTAVSRALLQHALDGWATPELADFVTAVCDGRDDATARLMAVGSSSGAALAAGVLHVLGTNEMRGAA